MPSMALNFPELAWLVRINGLFCRNRILAFGTNWLNRVIFRECEVLSLPLSRLFGLDGVHEYARFVGVIERYLFRV